MIDLCVSSEPIRLLFSTEMTQSTKPNSEPGNLGGPRRKFSFSRDSFPEHFQERPAPVPGTAAAVPPDRHRHREQQRQPAHRGAEADGGDARDHRDQDRDPGEGGGRVPGLVLWRWGSDPNRRQHQQLGGGQGQDQPRLRREVHLRDLQDRRDLRRSSLLPDDPHQVSHRVFFKPPFATIYFHLKEKSV